MKVKKALHQIEIGDEVETNGDWYKKRDILRKGRVVAIDEKGFYLEGTGFSNVSSWNIDYLENTWFVAWENKEADVKIISKKSKKWSKLIKEKIMDIKEKFLTLFTQEPYKSFKKAKIVDEKNMLTNEGTEVFLNWLLMKYADEFKKEVVDKLLQEQKEE
ncbi:MAG: hypothetical protein ACO2PO_23715 [Candidatus Calescibacterium sp.]